MAVRHTRTMVNGLPMHAAESTGPVPEGAPAVVLVHGLGVSARTMLPTLRHLGRHCRVHAVDLPGHGRSAPFLRHRAAGRHAPGLPGLADALAGWMRARGVGPAVLVGNSLGCQVIARLALRHPGLLAAAVFVGPTRDPRAGGPVRHAARLLLDVPREAPSLLPLAALDYLRAGPGRMWALLREALRADEERRLGRIRAPVLVVRGEHDPLCGPSWARKVAGAVRHGRLVTVPGAGHAVTYSAAPALAGHIRAFLRQAGRPRPGQDD